ncbi:regulatory protein MarR [Emticicia oligotrophica DSM 17448]|jgi:DNA-binding MarR family transcriptional regulator|uniref:Regulatory protein MarR n=1 Tax=Emticicia oligotrophica (strain DSM 17448 / CIP 109782 / MTCC 6937 / GPTSA100-15) TaxID=929562 RepID=A0ABM5N2W4_EMTOG|nr:MarR family winged helix-turn-helix transcriptional regulator [Emticicia oligotrophica]AFK03641.1 regulatory protein MarR [Emticicia oligotrophica DSM 17448]
MNEELYAEVAALKANKTRLLGKLLNRTYRYMSDLASDYLKGTDFTGFRVGHIVALVQIDLSGTNINSLAAAAGMTKQGMSKIVKELQEDGYVNVEKDPTDARALVVKYTEKGLHAMLEWRNCTNFINQKFGETLGKEKLETLKDLLGELVQEYENNYCNSSKEVTKELMKKKWKK